MRHKNEEETNLLTRRKIIIVPDHACVKKKEDIEKNTKINNKNDSCCERLLTLMKFNEKIIVHIILCNLISI